MSRTVLGSDDLFRTRIDQGIRLTLSDGPLDIGWRHSGLTSDFLADAMALPYSVSRTRHAQVQHSIEYLSNELIENAVKFRLPGEIAIEAGLTDEVFMMRVSNCVDQETAIRFQGLLSTIVAGDPGELLISKIEENAASNSSGSGLGLLTLLSDYGARMLWEFETLGDQQVRLTTTASLVLPMS
jgi:hypothetical protein